MVQKIERAEQGEVNVDPAGSPAPGPVGVMFDTHLLIVRHHENFARRGTNFHVGKTHYLRSDQRLRQNGEGIRLLKRLHRPVEKNGLHKIQPQRVFGRSFEATDCRIGRGIISGHKTEHRPYRSAMKDGK